MEAHCRGGQGPHRAVVPFGYPYLDNWHGSEQKDIVWKQHDHRVRRDASTRLTNRKERVRLRKNLERRTLPPWTEERRRAKSIAMKKMWWSKIEKGNTEKLVEIKTRMKAYFNNVSRKENIVERNKKIGEKLKEHWKRMKAEGKTRRLRVFKSNITTYWRRFREEGRTYRSKAKSESMSKLWKMQKDRIVRQKNMSIKKKRYWDTLNDTEGIRRRKDQGQKIRQYWAKRRALGLSHRIRRKLNKTEIETLIAKQLKKGKKWSKNKTAENLKTLLKWTKQNERYTTLKTLKERMDAYWEKWRQRQIIKAASSPPTHKVKSVVNLIDDDDDDYYYDYDDD
ncbi:hypothetical protein WDU94_005785 [Cyamophila willieti]